MTESERMQYIADSVEMDISEIAMDTVLSDLENWDSVAVLSIISVMNDKLNKFPSAQEILSCNTVRDLVNMFE